MFSVLCVILFTGEKWFLTYYVMHPTYSHVIGFSGGISQERPQAKEVPSRTETHPCPSQPPSQSWVPR